MVEPLSSPELVSVLIVTFNSAKHLGACLASISAQDYKPLELIITDNDSRDSTRELLEKVSGSAKIILNCSNQGFAAAQNQAMSKARGNWLLCLNPDVILAPDFISRLMDAANADPRVGTACGKLLRWIPGSAQERSKVIDSTGIYFLPNLRHLDRGAEETDAGQFERMEYVFGGTGAAALYRREMVEAVSYNQQFFDEDFFSYREDADLAWRAQIMGWRCLYTPRAIAWHERRVTPERFHQLPHEINWHSVKNRFLMRAKNCSLWLGMRLLIPILARDFLIVGYAVLRDWRLLSALIYPLRHARELRDKRKWIQARREVHDRELLHWFKTKPECEPFPKPPGAN